MHQLHSPFTKVETKSLVELIHIYMCGPTPVMSVDGYRYYVSFVDDFTMYSLDFFTDIEVKSTKYLSAFQIVS